MDIICKRIIMKMHFCLLKIIKPIKMSYNDHEIETLNDTKDSAVHVMRNVKHSRGNAVSVD